MKKFGWFQKSLLLSLILMLFLAGCGQQAKTTASSPQEKKIGVLDLQQAVKAHPKWSQLEQLNAQIGILEKQGQALSSQPSGNEQQRQQLDDQKMQLQAQNQEWQREQEKLSQALAGKMKLKQADLEANFQREAEKIQAEKGQELAAYKKQLQALYGPSLVNLQLKLQFSSLSAEEREKKKKELDALNDEQAQKLQAKEAEVAKQLEQEIKGLKGQLSQELNSYQKQEEDKLKKQLAATYQEMQSKQESADAAWQENIDIQKQQKETEQKNIQTLQEKIVALTKEKSLLESEIKKDLQSIAAEVAQTQQLKAVVVNYRSNALAVDITLDVIARLKGLS